MLGQLAEQKAQNSEVKAFGQRLATDHSKAQQEVERIVTARGMSVRDEPKPEQRELADRLRTMSGTEFDRTFMQEMVKDHQEDVAKFEEQAKSSGDSEVAAFARETLPVLQSHLRSAETIARNVR